MANSIKRNVGSARVYRDTELLVNHLFALVDKFPQHYKPIIGNRILDRGLDTMASIHLAYNFEENKIQNIHQAIFDFEEMIIAVRFAHEWRLISHKQHAELFETITSISNQLKNWRNKYAKSTDNAS